MDIDIRRRAEYENGAHDIEKDIAADLHKAHYNGRGAGKQKPAGRARKASLSALAVRVVDIFKIRIKCVLQFAVTISIYFSVFSPYRARAQDFSEYSLFRLLGDVEGDYSVYQRFCVVGFLYGKSSPNIAQSSSP